jgi:glycosyltransferase involved in cell wall biosynthesis
MTEPLITVLMPVYNSAKHLSKAIDSVLSQTFQAFEFVIIDDGSSDESEQIINSYSDSRIRFFQNKENRGISATLNRGIELANTEWIARMDADDICFPERLASQYSFIQSHPDGSLFSCYVEVMSEDEEFVRVDRFKPSDYFYNLTFSFWMYHPSLVYRRDAVKSIGMYTVAYAEDYELVWQLSRRFKIYIQPEVLLRYRVSAQSLWQVTKKKEYREALIEQIRRNMLSYISNDVKIEDWQIEQLGMSDATRNLTMEMALSCIDLLGIVTQKMLQKPNVNLVPEELIAAAKRKREYLLLKFFTDLGGYHGCIFLLKAREYRIFWNKVVTKVKSTKQKVT